ncbi:hypothetical protein RKD55_003227 [Rossellomorea marisflavi]
MKKIKIIESTNLYLTKTNHHHFNLLSPQERRELREYVMEHEDLQLHQDPIIFYKIMDWVHRQWESPRNQSGTLWQFLSRHPEACSIRGTLSMRGICIGHQGRVDCFRPPCEECQYP